MIMIIINNQPINNNMMIKYIHDNELIYFIQ